MFFALNRSIRKCVESNFRRAMRAKVHCGGLRNEKAKSRLGQKNVSQFYKSLFHNGKRKQKAKTVYF